MKTRKSTLKKIMLQQKTTNDIKIEQEIIKCPLYIKGCESVLVGRNCLFEHLENECDYFVNYAFLKYKQDQIANLNNKKKTNRSLSNNTITKSVKDNSNLFNEKHLNNSILTKSNKTSSKKNKHLTIMDDKQESCFENITKLIINKMHSTPEIDTIDKSFVPCEMKTNYHVSTKKQERFPKLTVYKRIDLLKEIEDSDSLDIGSIPIKSNHFAICNIQKNKSIRTFVAFRSNNYSIIIKEINGLIVKRLEGHKDLISEIKFYKGDKDEHYLYSSSFDCNVIVWNLDTFTKLYSFDYGSWVISSSIVNIKKNKACYVFMTGGYFKKYPIKVYNLHKGIEEFSISVQENISIEICYTHVNEEYNRYYLFVGSDADKPKVIWYDFINKSSLGVFNATSNITCIATDFNNKASNLIYSDSNGHIKQVDLSTNKITIDFKPNFPVLDFILWDTDYIVVCGNTKSKGIALISRNKPRVVKTFDKLHSKVIVNVLKCFQPSNGNCLVTLSADKKIKMHKML